MIADVTDTSGAAAPDQPRHIFSIRWKMTGALALAFTAVFATVWIWVYSFTTSVIEDQLTRQFTSTAELLAKVLGGDDFAAFIAKERAASPEVNRAADPTNTFNPLYVDDPYYQRVREEWTNLDHEIFNFGMASYYKDPADGQLHFAAPQGFSPDPVYGTSIGKLAKLGNGPKDITLMEQALVSGTVVLPAYTDPYGSWISVYVPVKGDDGTVIGGLHTDFPITYVMEAQNQLRMRLLPGMVVSYLILLAIVVALSTSLTRPLKRLTSATQRVAEGEYDLDVTSLAPRWLPDEIWTLASSITAMAGKVAARERSFVTEVKRLRVEVDKAKRAASVTEITQSDFFTDLAAKAETMRRRMRD